MASVFMGLLRTVTRHLSGPSKELPIGSPRSNIPLMHPLSPLRLINEMILPDPFQPEFLN